MKPRFTIYRIPDGHIFVNYETGLTYFPVEGGHVKAYLPNDRDFINVVLLRITNLSILTHDRTRLPH